MTKQWCAPSAWLVLAIISIMGMSEAQTHIFPAQDTNNVFTGSNRFNAGVGVQYSGITISRPPNTSAPVLNQLVKETGSANPRQVTNLAVSDTNNILGLMVGTDSDTGDAVILDRGRGQCVFDDQTVIGDWVVASTTSAGACSDAGATEPSLVQVLGRVVSVNAGAGTVAYMNLGTFDVVGNQQVNGGGSGTVAAGTTGAIAYYPQNGNQVGPDTSCTTDGSGHLVCKSFTASDANAAGFIGCTQGPVPTLSTANSVYFLCGTSIATTFGVQLPSATGTLNYGVCKTGSTTDGSGHNIDTWGYCNFGVGSGSVTSVATTSPITGGTITTTGTIACATCVTSAASLTNNQLVFGAGSQGAAIGDLTGDVTTSGGKATTAATKLRWKTCMINVGADNASAVVADADLGPQKRRCFVPFASTITEITVSADAGTPNVLLQRRRGASTVADLLSGALATAASGAVACAMASTGQTCYDGTTSSGSITLSNTTLNAGDYIELKSGTAGGTAKSMQIAVTFTIN